MRNYSLRNTRWVSPGHEMDYIASIITRETSRFYVVGNRNEVERFINRVGFRLIERRLIKGIVLTEYDEDVTEINNVPVIKDADILADGESIVICTAFERTQYESICELFGNYGFEENISFFQGELFTMVYEVYVHNLLILDRIEIFMTSYCSLNCKNCIAYIPYFKEKSNISLDTLKIDADILFSKVDRVNKFKVLGGEGLVYPYLCEYLKYVCDKYRNQVGTIRIGTNGTIYPSEELLKICREYQIIVDISDYRIAIGDRSKLEDIKKTCEYNHVLVDVKRTGEQWLDLGFPYNLPSERNEQQLKNHFFKCAMFCRNFHEGKLYFCCSNFAAIKAGLFEENENDYFDFTRDFTKKQLLEYELGFSNLGHTTFCKVCRGCSNEVNPFHVEVARQI